MALLRFAKLSLLIGVMGLTAACLPERTAATPYATRVISGPTLAPSPEISMQTSDELFGGTIEAGHNDLTAAAVPARGVLPPMPAGTTEPDGSARVMLTLADGTVQPADLYEPRSGVADAAVQRYPGVLLLSPDRLSWGIFPAELSVAGLTVLVTEPPPLDSDMPALLESLSEIASVDPGRLAVIGAGAGADRALAGCALTDLCDALVLLSATQRELVAQHMASYNPRPLWVVASPDDALAYPTALSLQAIGQNVTFREVEGGQGASVLADAVLATELTNWLLGVWQS